MNAVNKHPHPNSLPSPSFVVDRRRAPLFLVLVRVATIPILTNCLSLSVLSLPPQGSNMKFSLIAFSVYCSLPFAQAGTDQTITTGKITAEFEGNGGGIKAS
jgi:hypothetical protein